MTTILLDRTALLVRLFPPRLQDKHCLVKAMEEQAREATFLARAVDVDAVSRSINDVCDVAADEFARYDGATVVGRRTIEGFCRHVLERRAAVALCRRSVFTRLLCCISLLSCITIRYGLTPTREYEELKLGVEALRSRLQFQTDLGDIIVPPSCDDPKSGNCRTRKFLAAFLNRWGTSLPDRAQQFLTSTLEDMLCLANAAAEQERPRRRSPVRGATQERIDGLAREIDLAAGRNPNDCILRAYSVWAWEKRERARGPARLLDLVDVLREKTKHGQCICREYDDMVALALGTVRAWNKKGNKCGDGFEGADRLLSFDWAFQFCRSLGIAFGDACARVESRREHRGPLKDDIIWRIGSDRHRLTGIDVNGLGNMSVRGRSGYQWQQYGRILPIETIGGTRAEYVPLVPADSKRWCLRSVMDFGEDPIQTFFSPDSRGDLG